MALQELGKVAAALFSTSAPSDTSFLWMRIFDPGNPNVVVPYYYDGTTWIPLVIGKFWIPPVIDIQNTPPGSPNNGDRYGVGAAPTGAWSGHANEVAIYDNGVWSFDFVEVNAIVTNEATGELYRRSPGGWTVISGAGGGVSAIPYNFIFEENLTTPDAQAIEAGSAWSSAVESLVNVTNTSYRTELSGSTTFISHASFAALQTYMQGQSGQVIVEVTAIVDAGADYGFVKITV